MASLCIRNVLVWGHFHDPREVGTSLHSPFPLFHLMRSSGRFLLPQSQSVGMSGLHGVSCHTQLCFLSLWICSFWLFHLNGIVLCEFFYDWLLLLSPVFIRSTHLPCISTFFLYFGAFMCECCVCVWCLWKPEVQKRASDPWDWIYQ